MMDPQTKRLKLHWPMVVQGNGGSMTTIRQMMATRQIDIHLARRCQYQPPLHIAIGKAQGIYANRVMYTPEQPDVLMKNSPPDRRNRLVCLNGRTKAYPAAWWASRQTTPSDPTTAP
jgi:hypothetical protein